MTAARPDTWMPLYWGDYLRDTPHLSAAEHGAYLLLIGHYWTSGLPLPDDDSRLARVARMSSREWKAARETIADFFTISDGLWRHGRVDIELGKAVAKTEAKAEAGRAGGSAKWGSDRDRRNGETRSQRLAAARRLATHSAAEWEAMVAVFGGVCVRCGSECDKPVKDHIVPIYRGGSDGLENLQPLCQTCNTSKGPEAVDHRQMASNDWRERLEKRLADACQMPTPSQPPSDPPTDVGGESARRARPRPQRLDMDCLPEAWRQFAVDQGHPDPDRAWVRFSDHWRSKAGVDGESPDWEAKWRNWVRDDVAEAGVVKPGGGEFMPTGHLMDLPGKADAEVAKWIARGCSGLWPNAFGPVPSDAGAHPKVRAAYQAHQSETRLAG